MLLNTGKIATGIFVHLQLNMKNPMDVYDIPTGITIQNSMLICTCIYTHRRKFTGRNNNHTILHKKKKRKKKKDFFMHFQITDEVDFIVIIIFLSSGNDKQ